MQRLLSFPLALLLLTTSLGCGDVFFRGALQTSTISGTISVVQLSVVVAGDGTNVSVTFVTFLQAGTSTTIGFCGDQRSQFPMNQFIRATFTPGQPCASVVQIVIT
jgi:hypothetical protein